LTLMVPYGFPPFPDMLDLSPLIRSPFF